MKKELTFTSDECINSTIMNFESIDIENYLITDCFFNS